ncbi:MAG: hypothetical protein JKY54_05290 [Flavobacteriales bacterium]|nr:hypothetical protein [Flavobacteriales bacterium]
MRKWSLILILLIMVHVSCEESADSKKPIIKHADVLKELPTFVEVNFRSFSLAFWGCDQVESNRNWNALNDSVYLTVNKMPDSIQIFSMHGIENLSILRKDELSKRVKDQNGTHLDLVDWRHEYSPTDTLQRVNFKFQWNNDNPEPKFSSEILPSEIEQEILRLKSVIGATNWQLDNKEDYQVIDYYSRTFYEVKAWFNNGDSTLKTIVFHYAE